MVDEYNPNPDSPDAPGDGGNRQTDGSFWEVVTTTAVIEGSIETLTSIRIVYEDSTVLELTQMDGDTSSYQTSDGIYTRGNFIATGNEGLSQWEQYFVSFQSTGGGNSGKSWVVRSYPAGITITWDGQQVWNQDYNDPTDIYEITPPNSEITYYRGQEIDPIGYGGGSSGQTYYDVNIGPSSPPQPGDINYPDVLQGDFGLEVLNADGNQIWGTNNRVISFVNAVRTGTIPIPAGTPQTVVVDIDLTEFGWTLTNTSEIGVYVRMNLPVIRTSTGFQMTWFNTYGISYTDGFDFPFEYYVMRF